MEYRETDRIEDRSSGIFYCLQRDLTWGKHSSPFTQRALSLLPAARELFLWSFTLSSFAFFLGNFQISDTVYNEELGSITRRLNLLEKHSALARSHQYLTAVVIMKYFIGQCGSPARTQGLERRPGRCQSRREIDRRRALRDSGAGVTQHSASSAAGTSPPPPKPAFQRAPPDALGALAPPAPRRERRQPGPGTSLMLLSHRGKGWGSLGKGSGGFCKEERMGSGKQKGSVCTLNKCHAVLEKLQREVRFQSIS